ncbi:MAG TPA: hypothetical protein PKD00_00680 [Burkholderiales bacterium]|nr:hypothetical protein [Burkholderiales bacterium]
MKEVIGKIYKGVTFAMALIVVGLVVIAFVAVMFLSHGVGDMVQKNIEDYFGHALPLIFGIPIVAIIEYLSSLFTVARPVYSSLARSSVSSGGSTITTLEQATLRGIDTVIWVAYGFNILISIVTLIMYPAILYVLYGETTDWAVNTFKVLVQAGIITVMYAADSAVGHLFAITGIMETVVIEMKAKKSSLSSSGSTPPPFTPSSSSWGAGGKKIKRSKKVK